MAHPGLPGGVGPPLRSPERGRGRLEDSRGASKPALGQNGDFCARSIRCCARHTLQYNRLPGYFVAFDIYDKRAGTFASAAERDRRLAGLDIPAVRFFPL